MGAAVGAAVVGGRVRDGVGMEVFGAAVGEEVVGAAQYEKKGNEASLQQ